MGASEGAKFVHGLHRAVSVMRKFSFFIPVKKFPLLSVSTKSTLTTGTVTEMEKPPGVCSPGLRLLLALLVFCLRQARILTAESSTQK